MTDPHQYAEAALFLRVFAWVIIASMAVGVGGYLINHHIVLFFVYLVCVVAFCFLAANRLEKKSKTFFK